MNHIAILCWQFMYIKFSFVDFIAVLHCFCYFRYCLHACICIKLVNTDLKEEWAQMDGPGISNNAAINPGIAITFIELN